MQESGIGHYNRMSQTDNLTSGDNVELIDNCYILVYSCLLAHFQLRAIASTRTDDYFVLLTNTKMRTHHKVIILKGKLNVRLVILRHLNEEMCVCGGREMNEDGRDEDTVHTLYPAITHWYPST